MSRKRIYKTSPIHYSILLSKYKIILSQAKYYDQNYDNEGFMDLIILLKNSQLLNYSFKDAINYL